MSSDVIDNYNVSKLYANLSDNSAYENSNNIFGIIEIPKINIYYPIFSNLSDELLKIAPCKFYGSTLNRNDNICIAGHNYQKENKFYRLTELETGDELYLLDNKNGKYRYIVSAIYQVKPENTSPIDQETNGKRMVTLITCTKYSKNRIIVQALEG